MEVFVYDLFESDREKLFPKLVLRVSSGFKHEQTDEGRVLLLLVFSVTPFEIDQNKKSKPFNRLSPESGNRKKVDMQRP